MYDQKFKITALDYHGTRQRFGWQVHDCKFPIRRTSAIHSVLLCDELLRCILFYLTEPVVDDPDEGKATLASLALVCKNISPLALGTSWERLDNLNPFVALLESHSGIMTAPLSPRMREYANYVRSIVLDSGTIPLPLLNNLDPPLFPHLRRLEWIVPPRTRVHSFKPFIVPSLAEVCVNITSETDRQPDPEAELVTRSILDALNTITCRCAYMSTLELVWVSGPFGSASSSILGALSLLPSLRNVSISFNLIASPSALRILSKLPSLTSLEIRELSDLYPGGIALESIDDGFGALECMSLEGPYSLVHQILDSMPACSVERCAITLEGNTGEDRQKILAQSIARKCGQTVHTLSLSFPGEIYRFDPGIPTLSVGILPTLRTMHLVNLHLEWVDSRYLTDQHCRDMSISWPRLRVFRVRPIAVVRNPPPEMVTLSGLRHFAENCPDLSEMLLQVNAAGEHWAREADLLPTARAYSLTTLNLTTSLVTSPEAVAIYLRRCFPSLMDLQFNKVEACMFGYSSRTIAWDQLRTLMVSDNCRSSG
ncbi:hypothetical protein K474DRAFT_1674831 [Panus rudis PR-1116 ss-1]|nr:hypothetical protein K474DRAFT_1674831 [Panus rudis PR-1116 ss-1]